MFRCVDTAFIRTSLLPYVDLIPADFDWDEWVEDENNVSLRSEDDLGFFECEYAGYYSGHYAFTSRGRKAINLAKAMLHEMYSNHGARTIRGLTPTNNRPACWMSRQLGFSSYGIFDHFDKQYELFIMTSDEFYHKNKISTEITQWV